MEPSNVLLDEHNLGILVQLLNQNYNLDIALVQSLGWHCVGVEDQNLFDDNAKNLSEAIKGLSLSKFYICRYDDVLRGRFPIDSLFFDSSKQCIEYFQNPKFDNFNLNIVVLFSIPLKFVVVRPPVIDIMLFAGPQKFIKIATKSSEYPIINFISNSV